MRPDPRRYCDIHSAREAEYLEEGMDFRAPWFRREVFLRFYEFHLENRSHPGCVYYAFPWLQTRHMLNREEMLWLAYINGNTQNIVTSWIIFREFPWFEGLDLRKLEKWFGENYAKLAWDTDRRYHKKDFIRAVDEYMRLTDLSQEDYFATLAGPSEEESFDNLWHALRKSFHTLGRLSAFSYAEYLRIVGLDVQCSGLMLRDLNGSKSHRNGLALVLGRDDLDWHKSGTFRGDYTPEEMDWLELEAALLMREVLTRVHSSNAVPQRDVGYFTLESALCTYKSWHRVNRRYPNVYNDMFCERIRAAESNFPDAGLGQFWAMRAECVPAHLRLECCPNDPGVRPEKQNWYREHGVPVMMSRRWGVFDNEFDRRVWTW